MAQTACPTQAHGHGVLENEGRRLQFTSTVALLTEHSKSLTRHKRNSPAVSPIPGVSQPEAWIGSIDVGCIDSVNT